MNPEDIVKGTLEKIVSAAGECLPISEDVTLDLYKYICRLSSLWIEKMLVEQNAIESLTLRSVIRLFRRDCTKLLRLARYIQIMSERAEISGSMSENINYDDTSLNSDCLSSESIAYIETVQSKRGHEFISICKDVGADFPFNSLQFSLIDQLNKLPTQLSSGFRFRIQRIDLLCRQQSEDDYIKFSQLRQTATFVHNPPRNTPRLQALTKWLFCSVNENLREKLIANTSIQVITLIMHSLAGVVRDLIDIALVNRTRFNIELISPITPIEIKEAIRQLSRLSPSD